MAVEIGQIYRQSPSPSEIREHSLSMPTALDIKNDNTNLIDWAASLKNITEKSYSLGWQDKPLEPIEPTPFSLSESEWNEYVRKREAARTYALENDLRGTF